MTRYSENFKLIDFSNEIAIPVKLERLPPARSDLPAPRIATDIMEPVQSQLDGKLYDSKSALRATYRQAGVTEIGNDPARSRPLERQKAPRTEIKNVVDRAKARFERGERVTRKPKGN